MEKRLLVFMRLFFVFYFLKGLGFAKARRDTIVLSLSKAS